MPKAPKSIHMPKGGPWGGRSVYQSDGAPRPKPTAKPADLRPFSTSTTRRADPAPQNDLVAHAASASARGEHLV